MTTFVLATANPDKAREMRQILEGMDVELLDRPEGLPDVDETATTLEGNALLKAFAVARATGATCIADDTGLFVDALDGRPGVYSARFAGPDATYAQNVERLLAELGDVDDANRTARFRTVVVVASSDGRWFSVDGVLDGVITRAPRGEGGFGYDPVFEVGDTHGRTLAELSNDEKHQVSHRGRALRALAEKLKAR